jgi:formylglycine-generating enzyme required for sulfatase activity/dienelactone hydrolase/predicted Ser/Thr protein kinase
MIGKIISHYRIIEKLGAGGMGEVFLAEDERLNRKVALKFLPPPVALDADARARFEREAQTASSLDHTNVATIYEVGDTDGHLFIAMAYCEGETLKERIARGQLPLHEVLALAERIASGLAAAHTAKVVHRDLKPANIIVTRTGQVKILDFGLARLVSEDEHTAAQMTRPGTMLGTVAYMSPEQARAEDVDERTDIWAFGVVLYEMLAGRLPFQGPNTLAVMDAVRSTDPPPIRTLRPDVPPDIEQLVSRTLVKARSARTVSAADLVAGISACRSRLSGPQLAREPAVRALLRKPALVIAIAGVILALAGAVAWLLVGTAGTRWAREQALPEISRLTEQEHYIAAFDLASRAERSIPGDPELANFWPIISRSITVHTEPPGADIFFREYGKTASAWRSLGRTPLDKVRIPNGLFHWRIEKPGYTTVEDTGGTSQIMGVSNTMLYRLDLVGTTPPGMVRVSSAGIPFAPRIPGAVALPPVDVADYWIDKYEVTNREYKQFVVAGGYRDQKYWQHAIVENGRALTWTDAIARFHDATGRPGPATWELGNYPEGQDDFPLTGVSWYEAAAYAQFAGKELPTIYHWTRVASQGQSPDTVPLSNFAGRGPARVGSYAGLNRYGAYDMAGNAKEWVWNEADNGNRCIMGGGWDEPEYMFTNPDTRASSERRATFGFRCIKPVATSSPAPALRATVKFPSRDFNLERPADDEVFRAYRSLYSYDKGNLNARVEGRTETDEWVREKVSFAAASGNERMAAFLFLPKHVKPPFQTVVWFPPSGVLNNRSSDQRNTRYFDFIIRSGRAVIFPTYKSTYERGDGLDSDVPNASSFWRDHVIAWSKDLGRSIDYLETRPDIATDKLAYAGLSWGAAMAAILPAVEPRLRAVVAIIGGFNLQQVAPEVSATNFAPRVTAPTLMLNGRYDYFYPATISQEPMFKFLGAPADHKKRVVYETGHNIPRPEMIRETVDWLDRYLGAVR